MASLKKLLFGLIFLNIFVFSFAAKASSGCCVCLIDSDSRLENFFYKQGCQMWLADQKGCASKSIQNMWSDKSKGIWREPFRALDLEGLSCGAWLRLGYVGHWGGADETVEYIERRLKPTVLQHKVSISFDNTACYGIDVPDLLSKELRGFESWKTAHQLPHDLFIRVRANQNFSLGMWDPITFGKGNFWAWIDSREPKNIHFPLCSEFEGQTCWYAFQKDEKGTCRDDKSGALRELNCCAYQKNRVTRRTGPRRDQSILDLQNKPVAWVSDTSKCLNARTRSEYQRNLERQDAKSSALEKLCRVAEGIEDPLIKIGYLDYIQIAYGSDCSEFLF
jgi:hypothetical protein